MNNKNAATFSSVYSSFPLSLSNFHPPCNLETLPSYPPAERESLMELDWL